MSKIVNCIQCIPATAWIGYWLLLISNKWMIIWKNMRHKELRTLLELGCPRQLLTLAASCGPPIAVYGCDTTLKRLKTGHQSIVDETSKSWRTVNSGSWRNINLKSWRNIKLTKRQSPVISYATVYIVYADGAVLCGRAFFWCTIF